MERRRLAVFRFAHVNGPMGEGNFNTAFIKGPFQKPVKGPLDTSLLERFGFEPSTDNDG